MLLNILIKILTMSLLALCSICYAGDREVVSYGPMPGMPNVISYTKVHMDSITLYLLPGGKRGLKYLKEDHLVDPTNDSKHTLNLVNVEVNIDDGLTRKEFISTTNFESGKTTYWNQFLDWIPVNATHEDIFYVIRNMERYQTRGTIGDTYRPNDNSQMNTNRNNESQTYSYPRPKPFEHMSASSVLLLYQGKWSSPEGRFVIEIDGDRVRTESDKLFVQVELQGTGDVYKGEGYLQYINRPEGYSPSVSNLFRLYWDNGELEAEYYNGKGPHTTVRNRLTKVG